MRSINFAIAIVCGCVLMAASVRAQEISHPSSVQPTDVNYSYFGSGVAGDDEDSPSDKPDAKPVQASGGCDSGCGCNDCCDCSCFLFGPAEPWQWCDGCNCYGIKIGGHAQFGYHTEGANGVGTNKFNSYPNRVQAHQMWIYAEREADNGGCGTDYGYRIDYVYGTDGPDTQAFYGRPNDWDNNWNNGGAYGHAIPQLYADLHVNDLKVRMGHFFTIAGYEVVPATGNFFYSHAYTMVTSEPFTHTGVLLEYPWRENITVYGGWTQGWDTGFSRNDGETFLGGFAIQLRDDMSFNYIVTLGDFGNGPGGSDSNGFFQSAVFTWDINDRLKYVFLGDYIDNQLFVTNGVNGFFGPLGLPAQAATTGRTYSGANYLLYTINDCWSAGGRFEYFRMGGFDVGEVTLGLNYKPHANMVIRPEIRFDEYENALNAVGIQDSTMFGIDVIMTF